MSLSSTERTRSTIKFDTGSTIMSIRVDDGNLLDMSVAEAFAELFEEGISASEIINSLKTLVKSKKEKTEHVTSSDEYEEKIQDLRDDLNEAMDERNNEMNGAIIINTGLDRLSLKLDSGNLQDTQVIESLVACYEKGIKPLQIAGVLEGLSKN